MKHSILSDLFQCREMWNAFTPSRTLWDEWEANVAFLDARRYEPFFVVLDWGTEQGLLPLWKNKEDGEINFFGGYFPENREFWFPPHHFQEVLGVLPPNSFLSDISKESYENVVQAKTDTAALFIQDETHYVLRLPPQIENAEDVLQHFGKKHRKNLRYDLKNISQQVFPESWGSEDFVKDLVKLSIKRFGEDSDFSSPWHVTGFQNLVQWLGKEKKLFSLCVRPQDPLGVGVGCLFHGVYYVLSLASDLAVKNVGKYIIWEHIKKAIQLRATKVDFLAGDAGWKKLWNLDEQPYYSLIKR